MSNSIALDVWFKFEDEDSDEPTYEANTFKTEDGVYAVEWSHTAVGIVNYEEFTTYDDAAEWLESQGFCDFTS